MAKREREGFLNNQAAQGKLKGHENRGDSRRDMVLRTVMTTREGREFVYDLIFQRCGLKDVYMGSDPNEALAEAAQRRPGGKLDQELQINMPDLYVTMISEAIRVEQEKQKAYASAKTIDEGEDQ